MITLNENKREFNKSSIKFFGSISSSDCIYADPEKVESLERADAPNKDERRSFLGMTSFS